MQIILYLSKTYVLTNVKNSQDKYIVVTERHTIDPEGPEQMGGGNHWCIEDEGAYAPLGSNSCTSTSRIPDREVFIFVFKRTMAVE